jgi:hypothetical protein
MFEELQSWWDSTTPQTQSAFEAAGLVLAALPAGHYLALMVARALRARNFDAAFRMPGGPAPMPADADRGITPTFVASLLVRLTVWAWPVWWLASQNGKAEFAHSLAQLTGRAWALAAVLVAGMTLARVVAQRLIDCLGGAPQASLEASPARNGGAAPSRMNLAGAVGAGAYFLVMLLVLLVAADVFDWPLTRSSAMALWQLAQHILVAGAALTIGGLGARWARDLTMVEAASPEKRAGQYTGLTIIGASTLLAVAVLLASAGLIIGLAVLAVLGFALWLVRGYIPDLTAGLQLRAQKVREVWFEGSAWQVVEVGLLTTQLSRAGEFCRLQNRLVLDARLHGAPAEAAPR